MGRCPGRRRHPRSDRETADLLVQARRKPPDRGPGKLRDWLGPRHPEIAEEEWPAVSTVDDLLRFRTLYTTNGRTRSSAAAPPARLTPRPYPERLPPLEYPGHVIIKRVTHAGTFRLTHQLLFIANALKQHLIGLEETDAGIWSVYFGTVLLGTVAERDMIIGD